MSAVASLHNNTILHIIGPGQPAVIDEIEKLARDKLGKIYYYMVDSRMMKC